MFCTADLRPYNNQQALGLPLTNYTRMYPQVQSNPGVWLVLMHLIQWLLAVFCSIINGLIKNMKRGLYLEQKTVEYTHTGKIWNPMFINVFIVNFAMIFGQFMMGTLIPKFADSLGATSTMVGFVTSLFTVTALAVKPISGPAIDSFSKKKILTAAILTITVAFITYSLAQDITTIIIARLIHGLGMGFTASTCLALASDALPEDKLTQGISYFTLGQAFVSAIGPALGLALAEKFGYNTAFAIGATVMGFSAILSATMKTPPKQYDKKFEVSLNNMFAKEAIIPATLMLFLAMSYSTISSFLVLYAQQGRGVDNIGLWFTVNALCMLISRPVIGRLAGKYGIHKVLLPAFLMFAVALFMISISTNIFMFLFSAFISAWGYGASQPSIQALCMKSVTPDRRGVAGSTSYIGTDIGFFVGPTLAGTLVGVFGYSAMFRMMSIPIAVAIIVFLLSYKKIKAISDGDNR